MNFDLFHKRATSFLCFSIFFITAIFCQNNRSSLADQTYQPVVSALVLEKDAIDISLVNSLNSFWLAYREFDESFTLSRIADRARYSSLDHLLRVSYGFTQSGRWDLGAELRFSHLRLDNAARTSPLKVLGNDDLTGISNRGLSYAGLRARFMPSEDLPGLTLQGSLAFPVGKNETIRRALNAQRMQLGVSATMLQSFTPNASYFLQTEWKILPSNTELNQTAHLPSLSGFLIFDIYDGQWFLFPGLSYSTVLNGSFTQVNQQLFGSLGVQFQPSYNVGLFLNAQIPFLFESGSFFTEWVRQSYTGISIGVRVVR